MQLELSTMSQNPPAGWPYATIVLDMAYNVVYSEGWLCYNNAGATRILNVHSTQSAENTLLLWSVMGVYF